MAVSPSASCWARKGQLKEKKQGPPCPAPSSPLGSARQLLQNAQTGCQRVGLAILAIWAAGRP
eukprot:9404019-Lingulodinium_polyedra.AAC.1